MRFEETIDAFAESLARPDRPPPAFAWGREGRPDERRFKVYRNNVAAGLIASLEARYPVARRLVGDEFFRGMAGAYVAAHKPASALLIHYGADFAEFIAAFEPAKGLPYLPDVARLENAWVEAYHAAEARPLGLQDLAAFPPENFADLIFALHPSVRLLRLGHPAASIWAAHQGEGEPRPPERWAPEAVMILRPDADVEVRILPELGFELASALRAGLTLGEAAIPMAEAGEDVSAHLIGLISAGAIVGMKVAKTA
jgi:hypothetical protein